MPRSIIAFLFPSVPAVFASDYSLAASVERLRAAMPGSFAERFTRSTMTGTVSADRVRLTRIIPFVGNSYCPHFFGSFRETGQGVVLSGCFTMSQWVKTFMALWLGFAVFWTVVVILGTVSGRATVWWGPFFGLGFIALGVGGLKLSQWFARNDVPWLSTTITAALTLPEKLPPPEPQKASWLRGRLLDLTGQ